MTPYKKQRIIFVGVSLFTACIGVILFLFFFKDNLVYFYGPSEIPQNLKTQQVIRIGGLVEKNSLVYGADPLQVRFRVTDMHKSIEVIFQGTLPDLFREGQGVVAEGKLESPKLFYAHKVLAKHDENYMPPQVQKSLDAASRQKLQQTLQDK